MPDWVEQLQILGRVALAGALGAAIGLEREVKNRPAGLRTHLLVAAGAALFVPLSGSMVVQFAMVFGGEPIRSDPIRTIEAIVTGISFIGAGTIILRGDRDRLEGVTTAASILLAAAVGTATALGLTVLAVSTTAFVIAVLYGLGRWEQRYTKDRRGR